MKYLNWILLLGIALIGGALLLVSGHTSTNRDTATLSQFIIGRWGGEFPESKDGETFVTYFQLEFVEPNQLIYNRMTHEVEEYNLVFHYEFTGENQIKLQARLIDEWEIYRDGEDLKVHSTAGLVKDGSFKRQPVIEWPLIGFILGAISLGLLFVDLPHVLQRKKMGENHSYTEQQVQTRFPSLVLKTLVQIIVFAVGLVLSYNAWYSQPLQMVRVPWDAIITLEIGVTLLIPSVKVVRLSRNKFREHSFFSTIYWNYAATFLLGSGCGGVVVGLFKLAILLYFGSYPYG